MIWQVVSGLKVHLEMLKRTTSRLWMNGFVVRIAFDCEDTIHFALERVYVMLLSVPLTAGNLPGPPYLFQVTKKVFLMFLHQILKRLSIL